MGHLGGLAAGTVAAIGLLFVPAWLRIGMADSRARVVGWIAVVFVAVVLVAVVAIALIAVHAGQIRTELGIG